MNPGRRDNRCTVLEETETTDAFRDVTRSWASSGEEWISIRPLRGGLSDFGPGEQPEAVAEGAARSGARIEMQNVLRVVAGPYVGTAWRVVALFPEGIRQLGLRLQRYNGTITEAAP